MQPILLLLSAFVVALFSLYSRGPCSAAEPTGAESAADAVIQHAKRLVDERTLLDIAVGVIDGDATQTACFGQFALNDESPLDDRTLFEIGSVSKVFTGLLLADAVVRGEVTLEQPLAELLDGEAQVPAFEGAPIRLVHLATHTSGLPKLPGNFKVTSLLDPYADYDWQQLLTGIKEHKLRRKPGAEVEYSNWGTGLLGDALAHHLETSYETLIEERICTPLNMNSTRITLNEAEQPRLAKGISRLIGMPAIPWRFKTMAGAGGIRSTLGDMLIFARAQLQPERTPLAEAIRLSQRTHFQRAADAKNPTQLGLNWFVLEQGNERWLMHDGMTGGYTAAIAVAPKSQFAVVLLSNTAGMEVLELLKAAMGIAEHDDPEEQAGGTP